MWITISIFVIVSNRAGIPSAQIGHAKSSMRLSAATIWFLSALVFGFLGRRLITERSPESLDGTQSENGDQPLDIHRPGIGRMKAPLASFDYDDVAALGCLLRMSDTLPISFWSGLEARGKETWNQHLGALCDRALLKGISSISNTKLQEVAFVELQMTHALLSSYALVNPTPPNAPYWISDNPRFFSDWSAAQAGLLLAHSNTSIETAWKTVLKSAIETSRGSTITLGLWKRLYGVSANTHPNFSSVHLVVPSAEELDETLGFISQKPATHADAAGWLLSESIRIGIPKVFVATLLRAYPKSVPAALSYLWQKSPERLPTLIDSLNGESYPPYDVKSGIKIRERMPMIREEIYRTVFAAVARQTKDPPGYLLEWLGTSRISQTGIASDAINDALLLPASSSIPFLKGAFREFAKHCPAEASEAVGLIKPAKLRLSAANGLIASLPDGKEKTAWVAEVERLSQIHQ